jgi:hypothetical protein
VNKLEVRYISEFIWHQSRLMYGAAILFSA